MKHKLLLGAMLIGTAGLFSACSDDRDSNPTLIQPNEMILNTPAYINQTVDLSATETLPLTWSQPQYTADNAPVNATYEIQVSHTNSFTVSTTEADADESGELKADYAIIDKTSQVCNAELAAEEVDKALLQIEKWTEGDVPAETEAYIRINAYILEGTKKLNAIASNAIKMTVNPYYMEMKDAAPIIFYLVGNNFGDGAWSDKPGLSSFPMFVQNGYSYDKKSGAGEITYLNYFTTDGWKIQPADFNWDYGFMGDGSNAAVYRNGGSDNGNITVDPAGYYLITVNTGTNECTITKKDITPAVYDRICITGTFCDWADKDMTPVNKTGENHVWCYELTVEAGNVANVKFKIPDSWDTNWGYGSADGEVNTCGKGTNGGKNIGVAEGTWIIMFNDITGEFSIITKK